MAGAKAQARPEKKAKGVASEASGGLSAHALSNVAATGYPLGFPAPAELTVCLDMGYCVHFWL